jgi:hypothetical protein
MIDFSLTEEQKEFQKLAHEFAKNENTFRCLPIRTTPN